MTESNETRPEVTQVDREAAATVYEALLHSTDCRALNARLGNIDDLHTVQAFARHRTAAEASSKRREQELVEALEIAWAEAHKMRNASKLVGPYPNDPQATRIWARGLYHAGKDLCAKLKPYRDLLARPAEGGE